MHNHINLLWDKESDANGKMERAKMCAALALLHCRWAQIAKHLPGRTDNEVKNFWNSTIKKKLISQAVGSLHPVNNIDPNPRRYRSVTLFTFRRPVFHFCFCVWCEILWPQSIPLLRSKKNCFLFLDRTTFFFPEEVTPIMHVWSTTFNSRFLLQMLAAELYYNILDGAGQGIAAAGCAPPLSGADNASAQAATAGAQSPTTMVHNPVAAWADFVSQPLFLPVSNNVLHGSGDDGLHQYAVDGEFIKLCRAADAFPPPESAGAGVATSHQYCKPADLLAQQEGAAASTVRSLPTVFLEPKGGAGTFAADPALGPVMDFMEAILGSSSTSALSASSVDSFSANTGMQAQCWIP
jgi:hypothetical protein